MALVALSGRVDALSVGAQRERLRGLLDAGTRYFVVDLSGVDFLDSAGMAMLVSLMKQARQNGGDIRVVQPTDQAVRRILRLTRLDLVLNLTDSARERQLVDRDPVHTGRVRRVAARPAIRIRRTRRSRE